MKVIRRNAPRLTSSSRDAAFARLRRTNRWLIAGAALLTGLFTDLAANAFKGHHASAAGTAGAGQARHHHTATKPLQPPAQAPKPAETQPSQTPAPAEETAPPESSQAPTEPSEPSAPAQEAAPEPAPERTEPEVHESAPPPSEPSEPVISGGS
jgi:hypothetical protein